MREVVVPEGYGLVFLHHLIQALFKWKDYHLHEFCTEDCHYYSPDGTQPELEIEGTTWAPEEEVSLRKFFKKNGSRLNYVYDYGDMNEVIITCVGKTVAHQKAHFNTSGPNMIEDSMGFGGTEEIVKCLTAPKNTAKKRAIKDWLMAAFRMSPEEACNEPEVYEVIAQVRQLVHIVEGAHEKPSKSEVGYLWDYYTF